MSNQPVRALVSTLGTGLVADSVVEFGPPPFERDLGSLADEYLHLVGKRRRAATIVNYRHHLETLVSWFWQDGVWQAGQISPVLIKRYGQHMTELEKSGQRKASTVNNHLNPVRGFLRWLVAEGATFEKNPQGFGWVTESRINAYLADVPDTSRPTRKERALSATEAEQVLQVITDPRDRALFGLMLGSGLRVTEACVLRPADIQIRPDGAGIIHVLDGKGGKQRTVVVSETVIGHLYAWAILAELRLNDTTDTRPLWPTKRRGKAGGHLSRVQVYRLLVGYAKAAGITRRISPHTLRHSLATEMYRTTRDAVRVANTLGHSGLSYVLTYVKDVEVNEVKPYEPEWEKPT